MNTTESSAKLIMENQPATPAELSNSPSEPPTPPPAAVPPSEARQEDEFGFIKAELINHLNTCRANSLGWQIEAARQLSELQEELLPGEWTRLFSDPDHPLPIGNLRSGQLWTRVANNAALISPKNFPLLPTALSSLSALAGVKSEALQAALDSGRITTRSTTAEVKSFVREARELASVHHAEKPVLRLL